MQTKNNGGDQLARGMHRAQFHTAEGVSQEKWDSIFGDFDADRYRRNAGGESAGDAGAEPGTAEPCEKNPI